MVDAPTDYLNTLVDEGFSLVHITGYVRPKREWFGVIRSREFNYDSIDVDEQALSITVSGRTAVATGRSAFDATINGREAAGDCSPRYGSRTTVTAGR